MRILIVSEVYDHGVGGVQRALDTLVSGLRAAGDDVTVMTSASHSLRRSHTETLDNGATVHKIVSVPYPLNPRNNRVTLFPQRAVQRFWRMQPAFDVVHYMTPASWLHTSVRELATRHQVPQMSTNHTMPENISMNTHLAPLSRAIDWGARKTIVGFMNSSDLVTAPTQAALDSTPGLRVPAHAVSNGLDVEYYRPGTPRTDIHTAYKLSPDKHTIIYTGRLDGEKRVDLVIDAAKHLARTRDDVQFVIVGKGLRMNELQAKVARHHLKRVVRFTGFVSEDDKRDLLRISDVFVMASPAEFQCISALEALACGVPVVVAGRVALPELTDGGRNGLVFTYPDSADCAAKIAELLDDEPRRRAMADAARTWVVDNHSIAATIEAYRRLYRELAR
ncbi:hypothetical protein CR983_00855 [Candidatus Saccharibacteria bacterium]|nr:MAG: hypothetical protein CR983_00855 [Candidatus Saccharibacteria bacterium]